MGLHSFRTIPANVVEWARYFASVIVRPDPKTITNETFANRTPTSVIGRPQSDAGAPSDIIASANHQVLIQRGTSLAFDTLGLADLPDTLATDAEVTAAGAAITAAYISADTVVTNAYIAADAVVAANAAAAISTFVSGTYTPTLTNVTNLAASTAYLCTYLRLGAVVTVSGRADIDPTATGAVELGISLPIASAFTTTAQCTGTAFCNQVAGQGAAILSDATNDRASLQFVTTDTNNRAMMFVFQYQVI